MFLRVTNTPTYLLTCDFNFCRFGFYRADEQTDRHRCMQLSALPSAFVNTTTDIVAKEAADGQQ